MKKIRLSQNMIEDLLAVLLAVVIAVPIGLFIVKHSATDIEEVAPEAHKIKTVVRYGTYIELFGGDGYYTEDEPIKDYFYHRDYYIADYKENCFYKVGESWGFEIEDYSVDIDDDGIEELVCNCVWGGDGVREVYVYKLQDGYLWIGGVDKDSAEVPEFFENSSSSFQSWYVESQNAVYVQCDIDPEGHYETTPVPFSAIMFKKAQKLDPSNKFITVHDLTAVDDAVSRLSGYVMPRNESLERRSRLSINTFTTADIWRYNDTLTRIFGVLDLCAVAVLIFTSVKIAIWKKKK